MTRLSQQALSEVSQAFLAAGVSDVRNMETLQEALLFVRSRVRDGTTGTDLASQSHGLARAVQPLVRWILEEPDLACMEAFSRCDLTWNLYSAALSRTAGADAYPLITSSEERWNEVLLTAYGVHSFTPEPLQTTCKKETVRKIAMFLLVAGMTALGFRSMGAVGTLAILYAAVGGDADYCWASSILFVLSVFRSQSTDKQTFES